MTHPIRTTREFFLSGKFLFSRKLAFILWFGLSLLAAMLIIVNRNSSNNFIIFRHVFYHLRQQKNLYLFYPAEYDDVNLYGPVFSILIAPFALLPKIIGGFCWVLFNASVLFFAIRKLPIQKNWQYAILILSSNEMMNNASWFQVNPLIAACIILGFVYTNNGKEIWALFFIMLAAFIKIYGIVGFSFFFFSKNKMKYILWLFIWSFVFFVLPMFISNPHYIVQCYSGWFHALKEKSAKNTNQFLENDFQDISVMGMIRRIFKLHWLKDWMVLVPAMLLFGIQYMQFKFFDDLRYRLYLLCSVLLFTVIFSNGAESPTYIIAFPAVCLWYMIQPRSKFINGVFIFAFLLTGFGYSDIFTPYVREHIVRPYSLKALPCFIVWLIIIFQIYSGRFLKTDLHRNSEIQKG
jgi:hypothetical protein